MSVARVIKYKCNVCGTVYPNYAPPCGVCIVQGKPGVNCIVPERGAALPLTNGFTEAVPLSSRKVAEPIRPIPQGLQLQVGGGPGNPHAHSEARLVAIGGKSLAEIQREALMTAAQAPPLPIPGANGGSPMGLPPVMIAPARLASPVTDAPEEDEERFPCGLPAFDAALGGGFVNEMSILFSGPPGIGKSTLILQVLAGLAQTVDDDAAIVTGEETKGKVLGRARRIGAVVPRLYVARGVNDDEIGRVVDEVRPRVLVIDSLQAMGASSVSADNMGEIATAKHIAHVWDLWAKSYRRIVVFLCQVNKDESYAGARKIEHLVDAHFRLEEVRMNVAKLTVVKNRHGSRCESTWHMTAKGLFAEPRHYGHALNDEETHVENVGTFVPGAYCQTCKRPVDVGTRENIDAFRAFLEKQS